MRSRSDHASRRLVRRAVLATMALGLTVAPLLAQTEVAKLRSSDGAVADQFGYAISVSGDVSVVGASLDDDAGRSSGSAYVFRFDGTQWNEEAKLTRASGGARFGSSVSVSGNAALVGAYLANATGGNSGAAYVFRSDGTNWNEEAELKLSGHWGDHSVIKRAAGRTPRSLKPAVGWMA